MAKSRKCAGTATATRSPPSKKTRARATAGEARDSSSKSCTVASTTSGAKKSSMMKTKTGAVSVSGATGAKSGANAPGAKVVGGAKKTSGAAKNQKGGEEEDALEQDGFVLVDERSSDEETLSESGLEPEVSDETVLAAMQKRWTSTIYTFYKPTPEIQYEENRCCHVFKCTNRGCDVTMQRFLDTKDHSSTSNLRAHAVKCWGPEIVTAVAEAASVNVTREEIVGSILKTGSITAHFTRKAGQVTYSAHQHGRAETRVEIVKWVCESLRAFCIVEDPGFKVLMKMGCPGYYLPSASTVARDVTEVFKRSRSRIAKMLQEHEGALHFATDAWTSPNHRTFVAITVHFERDGEPISFLLDVIKLACSHTGVNLAAAFMKILKEFGIEHKIKAVMCDNVSNNDTMIEELATDENLPTFEGLTAHKKKAKGGEDDDPEITELVGDVGDDEEPDAQEPPEAVPAEEGEDEDYDPDVVLDGEEEVDAMREMTAAEKAKFAVAIRPVKLILAKIRTFASKVIKSSTILLPAWKEAVTSHHLPERLILRDRSPTCSWCPMPPLISSPSSSPLHTTAPTQVFKHATLFFSRNTPNLAQVILAMDHIDKTLTNASHSKKFTKPIRVTCGLAKKALNKYYSYTDMSDTYRITMMLHPSHKLQYFKKMRWPGDWQKNTWELLKEEFKRVYKGSGASKNQDDEHDGPEPEEIEDDDGCEASSSNNEHLKSSGEDDGSDEDDFDVPDDENIFNALVSITRLRVLEKGDELERYLSIPIEDTANPLLWWADRRALYPCLSCMALDYLSILATPVDVEQVFRKGRLLLSHIRSRMNAQTMCAVLCVGA
ncbi:hypothetical protein GSI_09459 [Ganoderma sinense ZZ0214-1]|uniref:HAT C-terminal dimerisation domain-containing protein n=1 Tax=Ganoderma sinense ZZ0214-1 TaxID=1077348 RepID=A0A2G8S6Q8_9APHY|nr:hypothetical protein GSI_09459 [Ganoderma sinense ZZ0214-1]